MSDDNHITDPMREEWYCPNAPEDAGGWRNAMVRHEIFVRTYQVTEVRSFLSNGRQWAFDKPKVKTEKPVSLVTCAWCGAKAQIRRTES